MERRSITLTLVIISGVLLAVFGSIVAVVGANGVRIFEFTLDKFIVKTDSVGLAVLAAGTSFVLYGLAKVREVEFYK